MSKGPGKWQALLLALVEELGADVKAVPLRSLTKESTSSAEYKALYRAARRLEEKGSLKLVKMFPNPSQVFVLSVTGFRRFRKEKMHKWYSSRHKLGGWAELFESDGKYKDLITYGFQDVGRKL